MRPDTESSFDILRLLKLSLALLLFALISSHLRIVFLLLLLPSVFVLNLLTESLHILLRHHWVVLWVKKCLEFVKETSELLSSIDLDLMRHVLVIVLEVAGYFCEEISHLRLKTLWCHLFLWYREEWSRYLELLGLELKQAFPSNLLLLLKLLKECFELRLTLLALAVVILLKGHQHGSLLFFTFLLLLLQLFSTLLLFTFRSWCLFLFWLSLLFFLLSNNWCNQLLSSLHCLLSFNRGPNLSYRFSLWFKEF